MKNVMDEAISSLSSEITTLSKAQLLFATLIAPAIIVATGYMLLVSKEEPKDDCKTTACYTFNGIDYKPEKGNSGYIYLEDGTPCFIRLGSGISCNYNERLFVLIGGHKATKPGVERIGNSKE